ncbi:MAG: HAD family hydrolase [Bacilli bacterium]|nr:HAD family hydrolase [Bacilli bacterium]
MDYRDNRDGVPKAENIRRIVEQYGLQDPLYVGDTIMDQQAAQEAGVKFLFAAYGYGKVEGVPRLEKLADLLTFEK